MKTCAKLIIHFLICLYSYWFSTSWYLRRRIGLTFQIHTLYIYDSNYRYFHFCFLPNVSVELRLYSASMYRGILFDYFKLRVSWLFVFIEFDFWRRG